VLPWSQATDWRSFEDTARLIDTLGYDHLWTWDHVYAIFGDPYQPIFEGWTSIAAWAAVTERTRIGLLVGANTFRNPAVVTKMATTIDHISGGRAILGLGGAWFELEHTAHGIDFGTSAGRRLDWLDEAVGVARDLLAGKTVDHDGPTYTFVDLRHQPPPVQDRLPIMIGGTGERKTLRTVARYADMWNAIGSAEVLAHKLEVLRGHCADADRDIAEIDLTVGCKPVIRDTEAEAHRVWLAQLEQNRTPMERVADDQSFWVGTPQMIAEKMQGYLDLGFDTFIAEIAAPFDTETLDRFIGEVKPMADAG
jgi:alkanesulfonate monooxygenase SsuD/methylene tetrahydromethanopterin reductase-like flavin-dependent oxidoreductase (luciferase family)